MAKRRLQWLLSRAGGSSAPQKKGQSRGLAFKMSWWEEDYHTIG